MYSVYPALLKIPKELVNYLKRQEINDILIVFDGYCHVRVWYYRSSNWIRYQKSNILVSDVHSKTLSSQCILCFINNYKYNVYLLVKWLINIGTFRQEYTKATHKKALDAFKHNKLLCGRAE